MGKVLSPQSIAHLCAKRPWVTIGIWLIVLVVAGFLVSRFLDSALTTQFVFTNTPESQRGVDLIEELRREPRSTNEVVVVQSDSLTVDHPEFEGFVDGLYDRLVALSPEVIRQGTLASYLHGGGSSLVSDDQRTTILPFVMSGGYDDATDNIGKVIDVVEQSAKDSQFRVLITGQATVGEDFRQLSQEDIETGEAFGVPIALVILVLVFGALVAALVPIVLAVVSIILALGAASLVGQAFGLSFFVTNIIFMIGLAVGIDYTLFLVARFREERSRGLDKEQSIVRTAGTAGRAVLFSGMTVVLALVGMLLVPFNVFIGLGLGAIIVVVASLVSAMTLLPAMLALLGDRIDRLAIPIIGRAQARFDEERSGGFWDRMSRTVMRFPAVSLLLAGGLLVAAAIPAFGLNTGFAGVSTLPDHLKSKQGFDVMNAHFSAGNVTPAEIVIQGDINSPKVRDAIESLEAALASDAEGAFGPPMPLEVSDDSTLALLSVPVMGDSAEPPAQNAITRLRKIYVPGSFGSLPDTHVYVTGETAYNMDFFDTAGDAVATVFPFVLGMSFLFLMVAFRSLIVPLKAVLLNLLSVGATYGILVLTFQEGWGEKLGVFDQFDVIEAWIPLFLFSILFGLSMDYHVFLMSRIRERFDQSQDNVGSVAFGIRTTGRLITGAALIMVAVFWGFSAGDMIGLQQMGFGLGLAILLDATIVRMVLVPSAMKLLGSWNWYLPPALSWLPDLRVEPARTKATSMASD